MADFINARVIQKIATVSEWSTSTILPYKGEIMLVSDNTGKVVNIKVGDGINHFNDLPYMFENMSNFTVSDASDVSVEGRTNGQVLSWNAAINKWVARNEQSLAGYATQAWVMSIGFLTEGDADLLYKPINWFPEWDEITDKPTTLAGFGITDAYTKDESDARFLDTLQTVTDRSNVTSLDISVRGVQLTDFLGLPTTPPDPSDVIAGRSYIWLGDGVEAGVPSSGTLAGLEDVSLSSLTNGQSLVWNATTLKWENATISTGGGTWGSITGVLSNQTDLQVALNIRELVANKATGFSVLNNTLYPTTQAVASYVGNGTLSINAGTGLTGSGSFSANQSSNASVTIGLSASTQADINLGVTAYGWGNHASAGYAVSGTGGTQVRNNTQLDARYLQVGVADTFVPYIGANKAVNLNSQNLTNVGTFRARTTLIPTNTVEVTEKNISYYLISHTDGSPVAKWETQRWGGTSFSLSNSIGFGYGALQNNSGNASSGFGHGAMQNNSGTNSSGFGYLALQYNTGDHASGFGFFAMQNSTGRQSTGFGYQALRYNKGMGNKAFGYDVLHTDPGAVVRNYTTAIGFNIPWSAITKDYQTVFSGQEIIGLDLTNARINSAAGNALVTKDWVGTQIGNGQLNITTGAGLMGNGVFNANQSGNTSISIGVASGYVLPTDLKASQWDEAYSQRHTHSNKAFLDTINQNLSTSSSVEFDKIKIVSLMSVPTSAPTGTTSGEAYIWVEMD